MDVWRLSECDRLQMEYYPFGSFDVDLMLTDPGPAVLGAGPRDGWREVFVAEESTEDFE